MHFLKLWLSKKPDFISSMFVSFGLLLCIDEKARIMFLSEPTKRDSKTNLKKSKGFSTRRVEIMKRRNGYLNWNTHAKGLENKEKLLDR